MTLKSARIGRAEDLTPQERAAHGITIERGPIIIEIHNPTLHEEFVELKETGFRGYLLSLGAFKDIDI